MNSKLSNKIGSLLLCILLVQIFTLTAFAAETICTGLEGDGGTWNGEAGTYTATATGTAKGCNVSAAAGEKSMTLKNTSGSDAVLSFTYTENTGTDDVPTYSVNSDLDGALAVTSGKLYSHNMENGEIITFKVTTKVGGYTSSIVLSDISFTTVQFIDIQLQTAANGSYTVTYTPKDSAEAVTETVTENKTVAVSNAEGATLVATPASDYNFVGWRDATTGKLLSTSTTYVEKTARTVKPDFISSSTPAAFQVKDGGAHYYLNDALAEVGNSGTIIVVADVTLPAGNYTIPTGVTLLIPYDLGNTLVTNGNDVLDAYDTTVTARSQYRALTMSPGAKITVASGGAISVSSGRANQFIGQVGPYGAIYMENGSNITVQSGGTLYVWGYIFHGTEGSGTVTIESGGTVYEPISIMDYPGSSSLTSALLDNGVNVFPMRSYSIRNVEVPMTLNNGAKEYVFSCLYGSSRLVGTHPLYILLLANGTVNNETPTFQNSGAITKSYVNGRMCVVFTGDTTLNALAIEVTTGLGAFPISSSTTTGFYIPSCWDITLMPNSTITIKDNVIMCEGSSFTISKDATVDAGGKNIYILDADDDPGAVVTSNGCGIDVQNVHGNYYTNVPSDAVLDINGKLIASGGFYTSYNTTVGISRGSASIISSEGCGVIEVSGTSSSETVNVKNTNSYSVVPIATAQLKNANGSYIQSATGTYNYLSGFWHLGGHTFTEEPMVCDICGCFKFYANVVLGNNLDMMFAFPKSMQTDWSGCYAEFVRSSADPAKNGTTTEVMANWGEVTINGAECYTVTYRGFAAKEMCDTITLTVYDKDGKAISISWTDSIQAYALRMLKKATDETDPDKYLRTVIVDMLNYGAACQTHFEYNEENLANATLDDAQKGYATKDDPNVSEISPNASAYWIGSNLITKSNIQFTLAFNGLSEGSTVTYTFTGHKGNNVTKTVAYADIVAADNCIMIPELVVADARCVITVTVKTNTAEESWKESIEAYVARKAEDDENGVFMAFMKFADSAYAYLHNK